MMGKKNIKNTRTVKTIYIHQCRQGHTLNKETRRGNIYSEKLSTCPYIYALGKG